MVFDNGFEMYAGKWYSFYKENDPIFYVVGRKENSVDDFRGLQRVNIREFRTKTIRYSNKTLIFFELELPKSPYGSLFFSSKYKIGDELGLHEVDGSLIVDKKNLI